MTFRADVSYLENCDPGMITVNAEEYNRLTRLIDTAMPELNQVRATTEWEGGSRELFDRRLDETMTVFRTLGAGFARAGAELEHFVPELKKAKKLLSVGDELGGQLKSVIEPYFARGIIKFHTGEFYKAEPLRQWEDISRSPGFIDLLSNHTLIGDWLSDPISISHDDKARADRLSEQIHHAYREAKRVEETARVVCVAGLRKAFTLLPDLRTDANRTEQIIKNTGALQQEVAEAAHDPNVRLPGMGGIPSFDDPAVISAVSPDLLDLRDRAAALPGGNVTWDSSDFVRWELGVGESEEDFKLRWIKDNKEVIKAAAAQYGIPAVVLAGIAYKEVGGKPMVLDDTTDWARRHLPSWMLQGPLAGDPDNTSYGPMAVQVRRAAESLGYDPSKLTERQRNEIVASLKNPKENIFIAAQHISDLKKSSDFALADPATMTAGQGEELAARYNGGPNWQGGQAQGYARDYAAHRDKAAEALK
jgi:hypothetical protein